MTSLPKIKENQCIYALKALTVVAIICGLGNCCIWAACCWFILITCGDATRREFGIGVGVVGTCGLNAGLAKVVTVNIEAVRHYGGYLVIFKLMGYFCHISIKKATCGYSLEAPR